MNTSNSDSSERSYFRTENGPTKLEPFDFGESPETILRALERNRRLLYGDHHEVQYNPRAVQNKIDELLDRLLDAGFPGSSRS
jgi:hypothetical protein